MLGEGVHPMSVERAATQAGYPVGTLQLSDELNMELMAKIAEGHRRCRRCATTTPPPRRRRGRHDDRGGSPGSPARRGLLRVRRERSAAARCGPASPSCSRRTPSRPTSRTSRTATCSSRRIETAKCFEEGVIESSAAANIGSIMGIGYPALTGGTVQFMQGYDGRTGQGLHRLRRPGPASSPRSTASASPRPTGSSRWRRRASPSPPDRPHPRETAYSHWRVRRLRAGFTGRPGKPTTSQIGPHHLGQCSGRMARWRT